MARPLRLGYGLEERLGSGIRRVVSDARVWFTAKAGKAGGLGHNFGAALGAQLTHEGIEVEFDCVLAYPKAVSCGLVGQPLGQKTGNVGLSGS